MTAGFPASVRRGPFSQSPWNEPLWSTHCTRLIDLRPGQEPEPICATLRQVNLDDKPEYEAVSYTWGKPSPYDNYISINDRKLRVRHNLLTFLGKLRRETETRTLWIDAISINQFDLTEKSRAGCHDRQHLSARELCAGMGRRAR